MKTKFLMAFLFCLTSSIANANAAFETTKPIMCGPLSEVLKELKADNEMPVFTGDSLNGDSGYVLFFNEKTKEFTIVQFNTKHACILGLGKNGKFKFKEI